MRGRGTGRKIVEIGNQSQSAQSSSQTKYRVSSGGQYKNNTSTSPDGVTPGSIPTQYPQKLPALHHGDLDGSRGIDIDLSRARSHVTKFKLTGATPLPITFSKIPPITEGILFFIEVEQDATGGRTISWPIGLLPTPTLNSTANAKTLIALFTTDNGITYHTQVFGTSAGGGSGDVNTPWTENQDGAQFQLLNMDKLHFKSTLNSLQIARGGGAGFDALDYESVAAHDFYVNKSFNTTPRFGILETSLQSNVNLVMNDNIIDKVNTIQFGAAGDEGTIDSSSSAVKINTNLNSEFRVRQGGTTRLEMDDATKDFIITGLDFTMEGGRILSVDDFTPGNTLQMFVLFGEQHINAASALRLQVANTSFIELDTNIKAFKDIDVQENDILNIKTAQIEEEFAAGFAPNAITDNAILFCRPNGSKTQLRVKFQTGNSILIAEEA